MNEAVDVTPTSGHAPPRPRDLPIVCLAVGDLYGMADVYISRLLDMLERHCPIPFVLYCYTDRPRHTSSAIRLRDCGAWTELERHAMRPTTRKLGLFNPAYVEFDEFLYLDLTLVVRQDMSALLDYAFERPEDLVIVKDWHYDGYNSSVMRIRSGRLRGVYDAFVAGVRFEQRIPGDQDFLRGAILQGSMQSNVALFPPHQVISFKQTARMSRREPELARSRLHAATIVKFHGTPKMHEVFQPRYYLPRRLRELLRGQLRPVMSLAELRRHWIDPSAA